MNLNRKSKILLSTIIICIIITLLIMYFHRYTVPFFNHYFRSYNYSLPADNEDFIVAVEPKPSYVDKAFQNIIQAAFPEYNIVYDRNEAKKPHLIIHYMNTRKEIEDINNFAKYDAPYISYSGERIGTKPSTYRRNGYPLIEFESRLPKHGRQIHFPYLVWHGEAKRLYTSNDRLKFLAYISSNCIDYREELFAEIKKLKPGAEALGKCSNSGKTPPLGDWRELPKIYANYQFAFAMENHAVPGYVTEKILNVFRGGAIPIYWGDSETLVKKYNFNPNAFIDVSKFSNLSEAAKFIVDLSNDPERIKKMRAEPIFINNEMPPVFGVAEDDLNNPVTQKFARILRTRFEEEIKRNN